MLVLDGKTFATTWPFLKKFPFFQKQNTYNFTKIYPILTWFFGSLIYKGTRVPGFKFLTLKQEKLGENGSRYLPKAVQRYPD